VPAIMRFRWQILIAALGVVLVLVLVLAVRGTVLRTPASGRQEARGGKYSEAVVGALQRLNPILDFRNPPDRDVDRLIFSGLLRFDTTGKPLPDLAEGWVISDGGTTYTFRIRTDALWQDGQPVTARDVAYTYGLMQQDGFPGPQDLAALWKSVTVDAISEKTVRFTLSEPYAPFLDYLTVGLLPEHVLSGVGVQELDTLTFNLQPIGSGPFKVQSVILGGEKIRGVSLVPFEQYVGGMPNFSSVDMLYYPTHEQAFQALQDGSVMGMGGLTPEEVDAVLKDPAWSLYTSRLPQVSMIFLNLKNDDVPFFQKREIRKALLLAIDRQRIIDNVLGGQAIPAAGPILPGTWAEDSSVLPLPYDPDQAAQLLDAAGWVLPTGAEPGTADYIRQKKGAEEETPLEFTMLYADDPQQELIARSVREQWAQVGVKADLKAVGLSSLLSDYLQPRVYQAALVDLNLAPYPDPDPYPFWHDTQFPSGQNYSQFNDLAISEVLEQARVEVNLEERARLYRNFQYRFAYQVPALLLWHPLYSYAVDARVKGIFFGPLFDVSDRLASMYSWFIQ
jgi:peptide/nickel transport system substrate-binding protein